MIKNYLWVGVYFIFMTAHCYAQSPIINQFACSKIQNGLTCVSYSAGRALDSLINHNQPERSSPESLNLLYTVLHEEAFPNLENLGYANLPSMLNMVQSYGIPQLELEQSLKISGLDYYEHACKTILEQDLMSWNAHRFNCIEPLLENAFNGQSLLDQTYLMQAIPQLSEDLQTYPDQRILMAYSVSKATDLTVPFPKPDRTIPYEDESSFQINHVVMVLGFENTPMSKNLWVSDPEYLNPKKIPDNV